MSDGSEHVDPLLDSYLDGLLAGEALEAFERRLAGDGRLRAMVRAHRCMEDSLTRQFGVVRAPAFLQGISQGGADRAGSRADGRRRALAIAAVLGLLVYSGWSNREALLSSRLGRMLIPSARFDVAALYAVEVAKGFSPQLVCETDEQFRGLMFDRFGQALVMARSPGVSAIGWSYSELISPRTLHLLVTIESVWERNEMPKDVTATPVRVLVFFDRIEAGPSPQLPDGSRLRLFHRRFGQVDAYEVTPLDSPRVLDLLKIPS